MKNVLRGKSILIVDDEAELREILEEEFQALGAEVRTASSGRDAFDLYEEKTPDVILSDVRMSEGDGIELLTRIRQKSPVAPPHIFLLTGYAEVEELQAHSLGIQEMITKPFSLRKLRDRVIAVCCPLK